ncbi:MAG: putative ABC transporter permease [Clostridia bacterium]|nr:putative ABC transporter permease [Clostridia bacterium]
MKKDSFLIFKDDNINLKKTIYILMQIMVICAFIGFIYEEIFYKIDLGYFVKRGSTFGPWIPVYAFGGLFITLLVYRFKKHPLIVLALACLISAIIEYGTGFVFWEFFHTRLWDYNVEIWNYGNINGYICLRSVLLFGFSGLFIIYVLVPILKKIAIKVSEKKFAIVSCTIWGLFMIDVIAYMILK